MIGTSGQSGAFTEDIVRTMATHVDRPIILPMSNPTRLAEAVPSDLLAWSEGRALIATGSPFGPVDHEGVVYQVGQANNALVFPGLGLGALVAGADRVTDTMLTAAAHAVAAQTDATTAGAPILPLITQLHETSVAVAIAVAQAAADCGVAHTAVDERIEEHIRAAMWHPSYRPVTAV